MPNAILKNLTFLIATTCFLVQANAQSRIDSSRLENIDVYTNYKPDVAQSVKIDIEPELEEPKVSPPSYSYEFPNVSYKPKSVYTPINPVFVKPEPKQDLFDNYVEVGGGNYLTSYLDASIHNTQDKYYTYGLRVKHHAANASSNPEQGLFSQNRVTAFGKREKGTDLTGTIDYQRNVVHYYGYMVDTPSLELGDINQIYNDINASALWNFQKKKVKDDLDIRFNIFDKLGENETSFSAMNNSSLGVGKVTIHLDLKGTYTNLTERAKYQRIFFDVLPHVDFKYDKFNFDLGLLANYFNDSSNSQLYVAPYLKAETYLVPDKLRAYAGILGGLQQNTLKSLSYENLFLGNNFVIPNTRNVFEIYAGMNGSFKRFVEYGIKMSQTSVENQYFFVNDTNTLKNFTMVFDDMAKFTFSGELKFDVNQNLDIGFRGNFYSYNTNTIAEAWQMPSYDAALFATIRIADKVYVNGGFFMTSDRQAIDLKGTRYSLGAINDLNIGAEYRYKKNISGFVRVNNILNQNYQIWNLYNAQGLNALAGVTFSL
ncbi:MAG: hypothetical protein RLZZ337_1584 [Bacteroidota bacterium]|jgi:hypothetical protein